MFFVSRIIEGKGLQYIIPGIRDLEKKSGKKIHFTIVGDGPYKGELERLVEQYDVADMVTFAGQKNKSELPNYYRSGDLFVFPSEREGMPNAVLEAMACGLPIVMSPCQGSEELIEGNGIISDPDLQRFNESILAMLIKPNDELVRMGEISRQRAVEMFSWKNTAEGYLKLYGEILNREIV